MPEARGVLDFRVKLLIEEDNPTIESKAVFDWATDNSARPPTSPETFETYKRSQRQTLDRPEGTLLRISFWRLQMDNSMTPSFAAALYSLGPQIAQWWRTTEPAHMPPARSGAGFISSKGRVS